LGSFQAAVLPGAGECFLACFGPVGCPTEHSLADGSDSRYEMEIVPTRHEARSAEMRLRLTGTYILHVAREELASYK
jgi:hypothetical protein